MKPLHELSNPDKAKLLHQLFPDEIPALLEFTAGMCATIKEDHSQSRKHWDNDFIAFDLWLDMISDVEKAIEKYGGKLHASGTLFSDQLFNGYAALFTIHCITTYTATRQHRDTKFIKAVDLLFNP